MLKQDLIFQIINWTDHYLKEKLEKVSGLIKDELCEKIMTELSALRAKK